MDLLLVSFTPEVTKSLELVVMPARLLVLSGFESCDTPDYTKVFGDYQTCFHVGPSGLCVLEAHSLVPSK